MAGEPATAVDVARLRADVEALRESIHNLGVADARVEERLRAVEKDLGMLTVAETRFVHMDRYLPVEKVLYGLVALILIGFMGAVIALVVP